jgi:hypothetical protein
VREKKAASCHWGDSFTSSHQPRREAEEEEAPEKKEEASRSLISLPILTQQQDSSLSPFSHKCGSGRRLLCLTCARNKKTQTRREQKTKRLGEATRQSEWSFVLGS